MSQPGLFDKICRVLSQTAAAACRGGCGAFGVPGVPPGGAAHRPRVSPPPRVRARTAYSSVTRGCSQEAALCAALAEGGVIARQSAGTVPGAAAEAPAGLNHREVLLVFSGLMLAMLLAALDQTIVATALPTITGDLHGLNHIAWVVTSYLL